MLNKSNTKNIQFHHYGLALKSFDSAIPFYQNLGYKCGKEIIELNQNVKAILCESDNLPSVELVKPLDNNSPLENYLKRNNEIIYHVCYQIDISKISIPKSLDFSVYSSTTFLPPNKATSITGFPIETITLNFLQIEIKMNKLNTYLLC